MTITRSIISMSCSEAAFICSGLSLRARRPPWILGWRVLTRPFIISGKSVTESIGVTGMFASVRTFAVPPVEMIL